MRSKVNWGAIFAGAFIALAANVFCSLFALAAGINSVNVLQPLAPAISVPGALFTAITAMGSFALGGYCTARLAGIKADGDACLHALTGFSVAGALVPFLFTRTFMAGVPGFAIAPPMGTFVSVGVAWTLCVTFGLSSMTAAAAGVWASRAGRKIVTRTYAGEIEAAEREVAWPAA